ncbi:hypothetical protein H5410_041486 [Solanum commersonii]|uniref:Uncharacterized protein n=1 Tax=Solanum commersonii TaxID=4109 RepID=A0A9J5XUP6_SOLCO|nr:hypothetical protein H5410_041486 [Solanum commersonii]
MSTHSLGHQSSSFGFATSLSDCAEEDHSATLAEFIADPPFNHSCARLILPWHPPTHRLLLFSSFDPLPSRLRVLEQRVVHVNSATRQVGLGDSHTFISCFFSPFCSILRLSVHASSKTSNTLNLTILIRY